MKYKLDTMFSYGNLDGYSATCYHCLCKRGEIIEEYNSITDKLYVTIDCATCRENFKVKYITENGFKSFELQQKDNGLCGGDPCIIKS